MADAALIGKIGMINVAFSHFSNKTKCKFAKINERKKLSPQVYFKNSFFN